MKRLLLAPLLIAISLLSSCSSSPKSNIKVFLCMFSEESLKKVDAPESVYADMKKIRDFAKDTIKKKELVFENHAYLDWSILDVETGQPYVFDDDLKEFILAERTLDYHNFRTGLIKKEGELIYLFSNDESLYGEKHNEQIFNLKNNTILQSELHIGTKYLKDCIEMKGVKFK
tara:strand:+ start:197 stop:715 length:519 start_codon:yes stop_codon:yes gene_type:complete